MAKTVMNAREAKKAVIETSKKISKRKAHKNKSPYKLYIFRVLRQYFSDVRISCKAMEIMSSCVHDTFERIAFEASKLTKIAKKSKMSNREILTSIRLLLPADLANGAIFEITRAIAYYKKDSKE